MFPSCKIFNVTLAAKDNLFSDSTSHWSQFDLGNQYHLKKEKGKKKHHHHYQTQGLSKRHAYSCFLKKYQIHEINKCNTWFPTLKQPIQAAQPHWPKLLLAPGCPEWPCFFPVQYCWFKQQQKATTTPGKKMNKNGCLNFSCACFPPQTNGPGRAAVPSDLPQRQVTTAAQWKLFHFLKFPSETYILSFLSLLSGTAYIKVINTDFK